MDPEEKDVQPGSSKGTDQDKDKVENPNPGTDDKDKNFANLRKKVEDQEKELADLRQKLAGKDDQPPKKEDEEPESKSEQAARKVLFDTNLKEVTSQFTGKHKVSADQWAKIKSELHFTGKETPSEIMAKIEKEYRALPEIRQAYEKDLLEKGRRQAMQEFSDDELDLGTGGDIDLGSTQEPRFTPSERKFLRNVAGISSKEDLAKISKDSDPNQWTKGKQARRAFFAPGA